MKTLKAEEVNGKAFPDGRGLTFYILVRVLFGGLFSLVRELTRRLVFGVVLFLITYKALVNAMGHAGLQWDHRLAGSGLLGVFLGCLLRPGVAGIVRKLKAEGHPGPESR